MVNDSTFDLTGRVAMVTGGAGLLGREHAAGLLESGATVFLGDIRLDAANAAAETLSKSFGDKARAVALDVCDPASVHAALVTMLEETGRADVLINNAAIDPKVTAAGLRETSRVEHFELQDWEFQLRVGLTGAFLCAQTFGTHMAAHGGGVILNIASDLSIIAPDQRLYRREGVPRDRQPVKPITYSVIKTGLIGLTRYLAAYWAADKVRVNALSPGGVYNDQPDEFVRKLTELIPMGRMAEPTEYRGAVRFLCSDAARYLTGQNIVMDGGRSLL
jgi:NAD(P)-dependent dehydrogenase (short-subunit alcohol dehydrogenase family)